MHLFMAHGVDHLCWRGGQHDLKFYFLHMNSNEVGTTLKHPKTINDNVKNLSKKMKMKGKEEQDENAR
jgi:hypothetical protein